MKEIMTEKEKRLDISMLLGTAAAILISAFAGFVKDCDTANDSAFRFHILANSDSLYDQRIKYALRDSMFGSLEEMFRSCSDKAQAVKTAENNSEYIEQLANGFLSAKGCDYTAVCTVCKADFPTRMYSEYTLPAGRYDTLEITLGSGEGSNWWCVLYPLVCLSAASPDMGGFPRRELYEDIKRSNAMTADSLADKRGKIKIRFALYEFLKKLFGV